MRIVIARPENKEQLNALKIPFEVKQSPCSPENKKERKGVKI